MANPAAVYAATSRNLEVQNQKFYKAGSSLGSGFNKGFLGNLDAQYGLGLIDDATYFQKKAEAEQAKLVSSLWTRHNDSMAYDKYKATIKAGGKAEYKGGDPTPLNDWELAQIKQPTSWQKAAFNEAQAIMDPLSGYSEAEQQKMFDAMPDLQRAALNLPVYSVQERNDMVVGELYGKWLKGTMTPEEAKKYAQITKKIDGRDQAALEEVEKYTQLGAIWWKYVADNANVVEAELSEEQKKKHYVAAFGGSYDTAVRFNRLRKKHGDRITAKTEQEATKSFIVAKGAFLQKLPALAKQVGLDDVAVMDLEQKITAASSWSDLKKIQGPKGQDWGSLAHNGVRSEEASLNLEMHKLMARKAAADANNAENQLTPVEAFAEKITLMTFKDNLDKSRQIHLYGLMDWLDKAKEDRKAEREVKYPTMDTVSATKTLDVATALYLESMNRRSGIGVDLGPDRVDLLKRYVFKGLKERLDRMEAEGEE